MATKIQKIKFLLSLIAPDEKTQWQALCEGLTTYNVADRNLFGDAEALTAAIAGQLHESAGRPGSPIVVCFEMACARFIVEAIPDAVLHPASVAVHGQNREFLESAYRGSTLQNAEFTVRDLADFARVSDGYVRQEIAAGRLAAGKLNDAENGVNVITENEARRWLLTHTIRRGRKAGNAV